MMQETDVLIVGAGSAGLTCALLLAQSCPQLQITILEQGSAPDLQQTPELRRVSALNLASQRLLGSLGVWQQLTARAAYQRMEVWEADSFAHIQFDGRSAGLGDIGAIVDNEELRQQLYTKVLQTPQLRCYFDVTINSLNASERQNMVSLSNGQVFLSKLLIGADGANSKVREQLKLPLAFWDYDHHGLVATVRCAEPHGGCARQVFLPQGPLALLPLADPYLVSIVWSVAPSRAQALLALEAAEFNRQLTAASNTVLGLLQVQSERHSYPLKMRYATAWFRHNAVLVADAAHTIHPLAGQGMNLGLMDVAALVQLIAQKNDTGQTIISQRQLQHYQRWRKAEAQQMIALMEAFKRGFMLQHPLAKLVRAVGMATVDKLGPLKQSLLAAAVGNSGDLPELARPGVVSL